MFKLDNARKNEIIAVILFAVSLFLLLSILSFDEHDLSIYTSSPNPSYRNIAGVTGAYTGGALIFLVGKASYLFPLLVLIWGVSRLFQIEQKRVFFKMFGTIFLVGAASACFSMLDISTRALAFERGGLIGTLVSEFLLKYLGLGGAIIFVSVTIILSALIATEFLILPLFLAFYRSLMGATGKITDMAKTRIKETLPERGEERDTLKRSKENVARKLALMREQAETSKRSVKSDPKYQQQDAPPRINVFEARPEARIEIKKEEPIVKAKPKPVRVESLSDAATGEKIRYKLPSVSLLRTAPTGGEKEREENLNAKAMLLEKTLAEFGVTAKVVEINRGPVITQYELELSVGTKVARITSLADNISLSMKSSNIRIVAPLPGKGTVGIEVPNDKSEMVVLKDILESKIYSEEDSPLKLALGKDISGVPIVLDLATMPHLLIAGATGSGKTVCINAIVSSLLFNSSPEDLKFLMVDPKRVELMIFDGIPHLISPVVTDPKKVAISLSWAIGEMERRYEIFADKGVRNLASYKDRMVKEKGWENLPYIVIIVDELADLMAVAQQEIEKLVQRLAQLARAAGIHMILATQRPSVNVITGVIKANFPARISFKVASKVDSRTVLDANGAEKLLGRGDMLIMEPGESSIVRGQCSYVDDNEIRDLVKCIKEQAGPRYIDEVVERQEKRSGGAPLEKDELFGEAVKVVIETKQASVSMVQRRLRVGYSRAARLVDLMEGEGFIGPPNGAKPRDIYFDRIEEKQGQAKEEQS
jgi:S-DNA-T family DNA segregation ATPase FtsK/SpoIIIE